MCGMSDTLSAITDRVRERVRREGVNLSTDRALALDLVRDEIQRYSELALGGREPLIADESTATRRIIAELTGFGVLQPYFDDPEVEELWINAPDRVCRSRWGLRAHWPSALRRRGARPR